MEFERPSRGNAIARALRTPARPLPHAESLQRKFGGADLGQIRAHIAPDIAGELDASAFALGRHVVFASPPDRRTVAHEAAHVVQQQFGRRPLSDSGPHGVALERHADSVAARASGGGDAAGLLRTVPVSAPAAAAPSAGTGPPIQRQRRRKLNAKQEAQRQRIFDRRARRYAKPTPETFAPGAVDRTAAAFREAVDIRQPPPGMTKAAMGPLDYHPQHAFPFDYDQPLRDGGPRGPNDQSVDDFVDRLPAELRRDPQVSRIAKLGDPAHGGGTQDRIKRGGMQEALTARQFATERNIDPSTIRRETAAIDFHATDATGSALPFDPFNSPLSGRGLEPGEPLKDQWAANNGDASYYKHTHSKGGDARTVGVWDQTYGSQAAIPGLRAKLATSGADQGVNVHELTVPLDQMYAKEHLAAERQMAPAQAHFADVRKRHDRAWSRARRRERAKFPGEQMRPRERPDLATTLNERGDDGHFTPKAAHWRAELAKHPYYARSYGS